VDPPSPYSAFEVFERTYPRATRDLIFDQPAMMVAGSPPLPAGSAGAAPGSAGRLRPGGERELYLTLLINFDWPPGYGRNLLANARHVANTFGRFP
jgi:hypothetical protein